MLCNVKEKISIPARIRNPIALSSVSSRSQYISSQYTNSQYTNSQFTNSQYTFSIQTVSILTVIILTVSILTALCDLSRWSIMITGVVHSQLTSVRKNAWRNLIYKACPPFKDLGVVIIAPPSCVTYRAAQWPTLKSLVLFLISWPIKLLQEAKGREGTE